MKKLKKSDLRKDCVTSEGLHVGIELELIVEGEADSTHDDDACSDSAFESHSEYLHSMSTRDLLIDRIGLSRSEADSIEPYFDRDAFIESELNSWSWDGCDDSDCPYNSEDGNTREEMTDYFTDLTGNNSFKVVEDGSLRPDSGEIDAEVCWNYYISKDTVKDNALILEKLKSKWGARFNKSCGLHINLNNYLKIDQAHTIPTHMLDFLFNIVAPSRRGNQYCAKYGMANEKYSMIFNQNDRLEFRFFSPTLEADKLHHYVVLANTIYKRLAGKPSKLPKKTSEYLFKKMTGVNGIDASIAQYTIDRVNDLKDAKTLHELSKLSVEVESDEACA